MLLSVAVAPTDAKIGTQVGAKKLRLLPGRQVSVFIELVVVDESAHLRRLVRFILSRSLPCVTNEPPKGARCYWTLVQAG
jgi:hypothetical protein